MTHCQLAEAKKNVKGTPAFLQMGQEKKGGEVPKGPGWCIAEEPEGCLKGEAGHGCHISSVHVVGCLGLGQVAEAVCVPASSDLPGGCRGWGSPPAAAKWGFLFSSSL